MFCCRIFSHVVHSANVSIHSYILTLLIMQVMSSDNHFAHGSPLFFTPPPIPPSPQSTCSNDLCPAPATCYEPSVCSKGHCVPQGPSATGTSCTSGLANGACEIGQCYTPVVYECPSDIVVNGYSAPVVSWSDPSFAFNPSASLPTVAVTHVSGSTFLPGTTVVTYTATWGLAAQTTCAFSVIVNGMQVHASIALLSSVVFIVLEIWV
jgi:hypothetical protein